MQISWEGTRGLDLLTLENHVAICFLEMLAGLSVANCITSVKKKKVYALEIAFDSLMEAAIFISSWRHNPLIKFANVA